MLGGLGNMASLLKQAKEMRGRFEQMQAELAAQRYHGEAGGGAVRATVDGRGNLVDIKIGREAASDVELLEDMVRASIGLAVRKSQEGAKNEMAKLTGGLNIPGLHDLLAGGGSPP